MAGVGWFIVIVSTLLTGVSVMVLVPIALDRMSSVRRTALIRGKLSGEHTNRLGELLLFDFCTNGIWLCRIPARHLRRIPAFAHPIDNAQIVLSERIPGCNSRAIGESVLALSLLSALVSFALTGNVLLVLAGAVMPLTVIRMKTRQWFQRRKSQLKEQLPDALRGLGMCFMAGLSLEQAFFQTAQECREPLKRELRKTVDDLHTGSSIMESLEGLDARLAMDEMRFVSVALEIQHRTGGSMREVLDSAADSMMASFDLSRSLEVQTAQARLSARIVSILPLALVVVLSVAMDGYLTSFFSSAAGFILLACAVCMQVAGIVIIRRILGIDLE